MVMKMKIASAVAMASTLSSQYGMGFFSANEGRETCGPTKEKSFTRHRKKSNKMRLHNKRKSAQRRKIRKMLRK